MMFPSSNYMSSASLSPIDYLSFFQPAHQLSQSLLLQPYHLQTWKHNVKPLPHFEIDIALGQPYKKLKDNFENTPSSKESKNKIRPSKELTKPVIKIEDSDDTNDSEDDCIIIDAPKSGGGPNSNSLVMKDPHIDFLRANWEREQKEREMRALELRQREYFLEVQRLSLMSTIMCQNNPFIFSENLLNSAPNLNFSLSQNLNTYQYPNGPFISQIQTQSTQSSPDIPVVVLEDKTNDPPTDIKNKLSIKSGLLSSVSLNEALQNTEANTAVGIKFQAQIPKFTLNKCGKHIKPRKPRMVWNPELIEKDELEKTLLELGKIIRKDVSNQGKALRILRSFNMDNEKMLATIRRNKQFYRDVFEAKIFNIKY